MAKGNMSYKRFIKACPGGNDKGFYGPWSKTRLCGTTSGMSGNQFLIHIFETNEMLPNSEKLTDEDIGKILEEEFPGSFYAKVTDPKKTNITVSKFRYRYNTGLNDRFGIPPKIRSWRYSEDGIVCRCIFGNHIPIKIEEMKKLLAKHEKYRMLKVREAAEQKQLIIETQSKLLHERKRKVTAKKKALLVIANKKRKRKALGFKN